MDRRRHDSNPDFNAGHRTKKVALPGGKIIEIVYFCDSQSDCDPLPFRGVPVGDDVDLFDLHVCPRCTSELVYPISQEERDGDLWKIDRRCPNCEWKHSGEFTQDEVELFDDALNDGIEDLLIALRELVRANMERDVERLIEAIHTGLIEPMDF
ncbi:hypothetical protein HY857_00030 [Candidatus Saccharibacteria bacterium]|nr:hypothetical protein [Candidatus Saccharibacteria bacterium]